MRVLKPAACAGLILATVGAWPQQLQRIPPTPGHLLYLPKNMRVSKKKWPLILYLHGKSLRGSDLSKVSKYGLPRRLLTDRAFPFIVVCPQLPSDQRWTDTRALASLVNDIAREYPVDRSRVYAVGFSMGASGVWRVAHDYPRMFAALVSVGGMYEKPLAVDGKLKQIPVWMIHGSADTEASPSGAKETFLAFQKSGGQGRFSMLDGKGHNIPAILEKGDVYHWLLQHRLQSKIKV